MTNPITPRDMETMLASFRFMFMLLPIIFVTHFLFLLLFMKPYAIFLDLFKPYPFFLSYLIICAASLSSAFVYLLFLPGILLPHIQKFPKQILPLNSCWKNVVSSCNRFGWFGLPGLVVVWFIVVVGVVDVDVLVVVLQPLTAKHETVVVELEVVVDVDVLVVARVEVVVAIVVVIVVDLTEVVGNVVVGVAPTVINMPNPAQFQTGGVSESETAYV